MVFLQLTLTLKSQTSEFMNMIELSRTTPVPYDIGDLNWHSVKGRPASNTQTNGKHNGLSTFTAREKFPV